MKPRFASRRDFLRTCIAGAACLGIDKAGWARSVWDSPQPPRSRLVIARDPMLRGGSAGINSGRLQNLLDRAMQSFFDRDTPVEAWRQLVKPGEVVGLKVNCLAGRGASSSVLLVEAICERLQQAGIPAQNIIVWDRLNSDLESAGFRIASAGRRARCLGNDDAGYEDDLAIHGSVGSCLAKTLTRSCDAVINLPVLKDHGIAGVTMALKNLFGAIHNPNKYHSDGGDPYIADVNMLAPVRQKVRLTICDATTAQYEGGPSFMPQWTWPYNGLLAARDPVALDYTGWKIIERKRAEKGMKSLEAVGRAPAYIATAADVHHRLGTNDPKLIERIEV
jgi:uncharacterized protein (DUF362 family)